MKMSLLCISLLLLLFSNAQTPKPEVLTNKSIIDLVKAGLSNDVTISKINVSNSKFDLSTSGLIDLKKQGVPEEIISVMMKKVDGKPVAQNTNSVQSKSSIEENLLKVTTLNYVHVLDNNKALPLEKSLGSSKGKRKAFGYGGNLLLLEAEGTASTVKLKQDEADSFVVNMGGNTMPDFVLYKLNVEKNKRVATVGKLTISGPESGEGVIATQIAQLRDGMYSIVPAKKLDKGEYFFTAKPNLNTSTSSADVYAFTIL
jgi:hypothetical protein